VSDPVYDVGDLFVAPYADPKTGALLAVPIIRERLTWAALDPSFAEDLRAIAAIRPGDFTLESASADGNVLIVHSRMDDRPNAYYAYDRRTRVATLLFHSRPELLDYQLAPMTPFTFAARDGLELHGYLTLPPGVPPTNLPTVLYVHGGPWIRDKWGYEPNVQWLANRGYAVVQVNFRASTGYGKPFRNAGNREWAGTMRTDLLDARDWTIARGIADPKRFAIFGGSYGGYAVLTALAFTPDAFTCGISICGISNLNTFLASIPPYWGHMLSRLHETVGKDPAFLDAQSPLGRAADIRAPLLIGHGANDKRATITESDRIVAAMRANGIPVTYVVFENEGHGFADPANNKRFTALAEAFLGEHLGGRVEPAEPDEAIDAFLR
jgi:dipeptidyl aminopeptidase/acylaminoacyl peptidase